MITKIVNKGRTWWRHGKHKVNPADLQNKSKERPIDLIDTSKTNWSKRKK